ncbi:MAG: HyaD/HybD family hydrogenase maturation endopeptidase [Candidatus Sedimenticola sp. PURPLELP]
MDSKGTLVLGIGNTLLTDEGVGIHVINHLEQDFGEDEEVTLLDGGTLSFTLAGYLESHRRLIVVDAARISGKPGEVACFEGDAMDRYLTGNRQSVHEVGLTDLLDIAMLQGHYPEQRALIGIEPENLDWGEEPSPVVAEAIPKAARMAAELIDKWDRG